MEDESGILHADTDNASAPEKDDTLLSSRLKQYGLNEPQVRLVFARRYCDSEQGQSENATLVEGAFRYNELPIDAKLNFITQYGEERLEVKRLLHSKQS